MRKPYIPDSVRFVVDDKPENYDELSVLFASLSLYHNHRDLMSKLSDSVVPKDVKDEFEALSAKFDKLSKDELCNIAYLAILDTRAKFGTIYTKPVPKPKPTNHTNIFVDENTTYVFDPLFDANGYTVSFKKYERSIKEENNDDNNAV